MLYLYSILLSYVFHHFFITLTHFEIICSSISIYFIIRLVLQKFLGITISPGLDSIAHHDLPINRSHIVACSILEGKVDVQTVRTIMEANIFSDKVYEKLKKTLCSFLGVTFWKYSNNFNIKDHFLVIERRINSLDELYDFCAKNTSEIPFEKGKPQWILIILTNVLSDQSAIIMKIHHSITDGVGLMSMIFNMSAVKNLELVQLPKISLYEWLLVLPLGIVKAFYFTVNFLFMGRDKNEYKREKLTGKKNAHCSMEFSLSQFKRFAHANSITLNDAIMAVVNKGLRNYHFQKFGKELKEFKIFFAASLRGLPQTGQHLELKNNTNFVSLEEFPHEENNFMNIAKLYHKMLIKMKYSYDVYFRGFYVDLVTAVLPLQFALFMTNLVTDNYSCIYTSVPGPLKKINFFGHNVKEMFFFTNSPGHVYFIINVFTYNDQLSFCVFADEGTRIKAKELVGEFEKEVNKEVYRGELSLEKK